jgi:anti-sigma factor RsiW
MTQKRCSAPIPLSELIAYWLGELDAVEEARIDEHLLGCGACSGELAGLVALAGGIRAAFKEGLVRAFVTGPFVARLAAQGARLREYRVPRDGSVNCTVTAEDDFVVAHLEARLAGITQLDAVSYVPGAPPQRVRDIPFDPQSGEVVTLPDLVRLRSMPDHQQRIRLIAVDERGERVLGEYTFNHSA